MLTAAHPNLRNTIGSATFGAMLRMLLTAGLMLVFMATSASAGIKRIQLKDGTLKETLAWGKYTVVFLHYANDELADVAQIRDAKGRILVTIRDVKILSSSPESGPLLRDINGDGVPELRIQTWTGGAYCCYTEYCFDLRGGLKNTLIYWGREYHLYKPNSMSAMSNEPLRNLKGKGIPQLVVENDVIQGINGSTHGPTTCLVLEWNGQKYEDATHCYPEVPRARSLEYRNRIPLGTDGHIEENTENYDLAAGYLANALLAGEGPVAHTWLVEHGGDPMAAWLVDITPRIRSLLATTPCRIGQSQERLLQSSGELVPGSPCLHPDEEYQQKAKCQKSE
jgi:hypothetical protein